MAADWQGLVSNPLLVLRSIIGMAKSEPDFEGRVF
jgi:hypothetical protein